MNLNCACLNLFINSLYRRLNEAEAGALIKVTDANLTKDNVLKSERLREEYERQDNGERFAQCSHCHGQECPEGGNQRQYHVDTQIAQCSEDECVAVSTEWILKHNFNRCMILVLSSSL